MRITQTEAEELIALVRKDLKLGVSLTPREERGIKLAQALNETGASDQAVRKLLDTVSQSITEFVLDDDLPAKETLVKLIEIHASIYALKT